MDTRYVEIAKQELGELLRRHPELLDDEILRADMIEGTTSTFELLGTLIKALQDAIALAEGVNLQIERLAQRQDRFDNRRKALRQAIRQVLETANLRKVELPSATISLTAGKPTLIITEPDLIPDCYCRIKREPDKTAIKNALREGEKIRGITFSNPEPTLRIS